MFIYISIYVLLSNIKTINIYISIYFHIIYISIIHIHVYLCLTNIIYV